MKNGCGAARVEEEEDPFWESVRRRGGASGRGGRTMCTEASRQSIKSCFDAKSVYDRRLKDGTSQVCTNTLPRQTSAALSGSSSSSHSRTRPPHTPTSPSRRL